VTHLRKFLFSLTVLVLLIGTVIHPFPQHVRADELSAEEVKVPIIMYHLVTENPKYIGKYGITPKELEADLVYLQTNGYTTIVVQDLIDFVEGGKELPYNAIMLTFDDGNSSDYNYLFPLLQKYDMKAVLAIIGKTTDEITANVEKNPEGKYPNLTWQQVLEMHQSGFVEIQSHGFDVHHKGGSGKKRAESAQAYHNRLYSDLSKLQEACKTHLGHTPNAFIYPLGIISDGSQSVLEQLGIVASFSCYEGMAVIRQGDKDSLYCMRRSIRPNGKSVEAVLKEIKGTKE